MIEELQLDEEDGTLEELDTEQLELLLDCEGQDFDTEELEHD